jgi:hypothetical protein
VKLVLTSETSSASENGKGIYNSIGKTVSLRSTIIRENAKLDKQTIATKFDWFTIILSNYSCRQILTTMKSRKRDQTRKVPNWPLPNRLRNNHCRFVLLTCCPDVRLSSCRFFQLTSCPTCSNSRGNIDNNMEHCSNRADDISLLNNMKNKFTLQTLSMIILFDLKTIKRLKPIRRKANFPLFYQLTLLLWYLLCSKVLKEYKRMFFLTF